MHIYVPLIHEKQSESEGKARAGAEAHMSNPLKVQRQSAVLNYPQVSAISDRPAFYSLCSYTIVL